MIPTDSSDAREMREREAAAPDWTPPPQVTCLRHRSVPADYSRLCASCRAGLTAEEIASDVAELEAARR